MGEHRYKQSPERPQKKRDYDPKTVWFHPGDGSESDSHDNGRPDASANCDAHRIEG